MKYYWSYSKFPELARYNKRQQKVIWLNYAQWKWSKRYERRSWMRFLPIYIIFSFVTGIVLGAVYLPNPQWGGLIGGLAGLFILMPFMIYFGINTRRPLLRLYLKSRDFSLFPVNKQVRFFLDPFISHKVTIDLMTYDPKRDVHILVVVEQSDGGTYSLQRLQQRLYNLVDVAVDGFLAEKHPESRGKSVVIRLDCYNTPREECERFFFQFAEHIYACKEIQTTIAKQGHIKDIDFEFTWHTVTNAA